MAEPIGLVLGSVALVSLFSTCVELLDCVELRKRYQYDYNKACLKLSLLRARLDSWGHVLGVRNTGHEAEKLRQNWARVQDVIEQSLVGIKNIFGDAEVLKDKYSLTPGASNKLFPSLVTRKKSGAALEQKGSSNQLSARSRLSLVHRSTKWAIRDKGKFDEFLHDLEFFISNLEYVQSRLTMPQDAERKAQESDSNEQNNRSDKGKSPQPSQAGGNSQSSYDHSGRSRNALSLGGDSFHIGTMSGHAVIFQGIQGESMIRTAGSGERNVHRVGEVGGYATVSQGSINDALAKAVLQNRLEISKTNTASANPHQPNTEEQNPAAGNERVDSSIHNRKKSNSSKKRNGDGSGNGSSTA